MTDGEQIDAFAGDLARLIDRYRSEFNLTVAAAIGVLELAKLDIWAEETNRPPSP